jgi:hypothetical protein
MEVSNMSEPKPMSRSREAWAEFGDEFTDIARRFRENYESISEAAEGGSEQSRRSIERAVESIRKAFNEMSSSLSETLRDPKVREETAEAGSSLLHAFGVTLSELGGTLQRDAEDGKTK